MLQARRNLLTFGLFAAVLLPRTASAQKNDRTFDKKQRTLALAEDEVKQLILLMDTNKNGKVSKKEFMDFMSAEFDRLDRDNSGELDPAELTQSQIRPSRPAVGK
ncbi:MAG: EF-hand domain-containing protein [Acidobacteriia bacterium]|nr:EF-hand domain-containing protein [Terriglobia bacterium]MBV9744700.1 EF-hand domain-containing protein [Terriglobia bacterium]